MSGKKNGCEVVPLSEKRTTFACGHRGPERFAHSFWGERRDIKPEVLAKKEKCGSCWLDEMLKVIVRCGKCGLPIYPGDGVVRYPDTDPTLPVIGVHLVDGTRLGCLRVACCDSPLQLSGEWDGEKFKPLFGGMVVDDDFDGPCTD